MTNDNQDPILKSRKPVSKTTNMRSTFLIAAGLIKAEFIRLIAWVSIVGSV